ncbi:Multidrug resistance ABC transporter ATP-binding/permease protein BmrA [Streptomyces lavendulae subsp. lavendulae]|uniref:Multidrug resistance ABC transporter ATP-binding/permease protein BmrA n=1 Tax=Streptomyces lavendulae subsp. lavendulae TaxID=58340 RepID=A0A2K8PIA2_STRLA|nr:ABC transporter ATP-binding protein [Streptomyces lavendulae]ATZ25830.1 Multidrug resistance ABC transporter ATP-binding/permease protein BmrA [Streptomyces lavendulae subsp. lavendulae]QUQ55659.1 Multidrug resistance ABC transporter ATP-binding/permease protein BmrA [Streptomyces lavendulae subsp. lavendulae]
MNTSDAEQPKAERPALRALLSYARPHRGVLSVVLLLTLLASAAGLAQPMVIQTVLGNLMTGAGLRDELLLLIGLLLLSIALMWGQAWLSERTAERVVLHVRRGLISRLIRLRTSELDRTEPGGLTTRVTSDSTLVQHAATGGLIQIVDGSIHLLATIVLMGVTSLPLLGITSVVLLVVGVAMGVVMPRIRQVTTQAQESVGAIGAALDRALGAARTVKANGGEAKETGRADAAAERAYRAGLVGARYQAMIAVLAGLVVQASFLAVIGFGGALVATRSLDLAALIGFLLYLFNLGGPILSLVSGTTALQQGLGALARIEEVQGMEIEEDVDLTPAQPSGPPPEVVVEGLEFAYQGRTPTLKGTSFTAPAGAITAIIGSSGSGKTTVFSLIQRFYETDAGSIRLDGTDIRSLSRADLRRRIAYVEQDSPMLAGTLRENLLYSAPDATDEAVAEVLRKTLLDEFVAGLPDGLDTEVGSRGLALSGGERQRLAIARALLREPQVLLLDEVTAHLDGLSEIALRKTVEQAAENCTVLLIAHRLSTVTTADRLILFDDGRVRDHGPHGELLQRNDLYRELAATQLASAR